MQKKPKKLVLFDIDGTLINTKHGSVKHWKHSIEKAFETVFTALPAFDERGLNGKLERRYFRELSNLIHIPEADFEDKFADAISVFTDQFIAAIEAKHFELYRIPEAYALARDLHAEGEVSMGLLTGNNERLAWYKLKAANFDVEFTFGAFGTEVEHRGELVKRAALRAAKHFSAVFDAGNVIVVGDTKFDIEAAKYAGAYAVGVATGLTDTADDLADAGADLVVESLSDPRVRTLLAG